MRVAELRFVVCFYRRDLKSFPRRLLGFLPGVHVGWKPDITDQDEPLDGLTRASLVGSHRSTRKHLCV
jgi:hypothetical protein